MPQPHTILHITSHTIQTSRAQTTNEKMFKIRHGRVLRAARNWALVEERAFQEGSITNDGALLFQVCERAHGHMAHGHMAEGKEKKKREKEKGEIY